MRRLWLVLAAVTALAAAGVACAPAAPAARLGQQVSLAVGQTASIEGEDLSVKFLDVTEDSRCPKNVTCIWEGRVTCSVGVTKGGQKQTVNLTHPGLSADGTTSPVSGYSFTFDVSPYPEAGVQIAKTEYRMLLTVNRR